MSCPPDPLVFLPLTPDDGVLAKAYGTLGAKYTFLSVKSGNRAILSVRAQGTIHPRLWLRNCFCGLLGSPNLFWSKDDKDPPAPDNMPTVDTLQDLFCGTAVRLKLGPRALPPNRFFLAIEGRELPAGLTFTAGVGPLGPDRLPTLLTR